MTPNLLLHRSPVYAFQAPRLLPPLLVFLAAVGATLGFGQVMTAAMTGHYPRWMAGLNLVGASDVRALLVLIGLTNGFASMLVASAYGLRSWTVLGHKLGWYPVMESEGPCRLVQDAPQLWGLQMEMCGGEDPGSAWPLTTRNEPALTCHLLFRLDEAAAGAISRHSNPGDILRLRWLDLPAISGGPSLLEICSPREEAVSVPAESREPERLAA
jgi:hypothetical protein